MNKNLQRILVVLFILIILGLLAWITYRDSVNSQSFWQNFWPNFWSDLVIGIILVPFIVWLISRTKNIEAKVIAAQAKVIANEATVDASTHRFTFSVRNTSPRCFNKEEVYWHVFVENEYYVSHEEAKRNTVQSHEIIVDIKGKPFRHITGILEAPVFPHRYVQILYVTAKTPLDRQLDLHYFLSTVHGVFPKTVKLNKNGEEIPETFGRVDRHSFI